MEDRTRREPAGGRHRARRLWAAGVALALGAATAACGGPTPAARPHGGGGAGRVLLVGTFEGHAGAYRTIQQAVDAARPGDWILVAPGDYHEDDDLAHPPSAAAAGAGEFGAVRITTPDLHLRGMDRASVIVDGTRPGGGTPCSAAPGAQELGAAGAGGAPDGRNGIVVDAPGVSVENLTVCNFLGGSADAGTGVWWNGGDGSGRIGLASYRGDYLTATSTYDGGPATAARTGIAADDAAGPGTWDELYAANFARAGLALAGCRQRCAVGVEDVWAQYDAVGLAATNAGGAVTVEGSRFDDDRTGAAVTTSVSTDPPAPQDGDCPGPATSPRTPTRSCWVFAHNVVDDDDDVDVPQAGASPVPAGTGLSIAGGTHDTVTDNTFAGDGAWGVLLAPDADGGAPAAGQSCTGAGGEEVAEFGCLLDPEGDAVLDNVFTHDGFFANPGNADVGQIVFEAAEPANCYAGNTLPDGVQPPLLEVSQPTCAGALSNPDIGGDVLGQWLCDTGAGACPPGSQYPATTRVGMHTLPALPSMPDPCAGVPSTPWCGRGRPG